MSELSSRKYRIYLCPRCLCATINPEPPPKDKAEKRRMGTCKVNGKELIIYEDPQFDLFASPPECVDFKIGKPRKRRE